MNRYTSNVKIEFFGNEEEAENIEEYKEIVRGYFHEHFRIILDDREITEITKQ